MDSGQLIHCLDTTVQLSRYTQTSYPKGFSHERREIRYYNSARRSIQISQGVTDSEQVPVTRYRVCEIEQVALCSDLSPAFGRILVTDIVTERITCSDSEYERQDAVHRFYVAICCLARCLSHCSRCGHPLTVTENIETEGDLQCCIANYHPTRIHARVQ